MEKTVVLVQGMNCGACAKRIKAQIEKLPGIADVTIDLGTGQAIISHDPTAAPREKLEQAVAAAGYKVSPPLHT